jgi:hypothetical protein
LSCLFDDDPDLAAGSTSRAHGLADLDDDGRWVVGDLGRLADVN